MSELGQLAARRSPGPLPAARLRRAAGAALFWVANVAVAGSTFVVLAFLSHQFGAGELSAASVVLGLITVVAVVPGAVQLRSTAVAAAGTETVRPPWRLAAGTCATLAAVSPLLAAMLSVPIAAVLLVAVDLFFAVPLSVARGTLIGRGELALAGLNFALEAATRVALGGALGVAGGAVGLAAGVALGAGVALLHGRSILRAGTVTERPSAFLPATLSLGAIALLANVDLLVARRALGPDAADLYAAAALPAKGIFFALFALSWPAAGRAVGRPRTYALLRAPVLTLALGLIATEILVVARPLVGSLLGRGVPGGGTIGLLGAAMALAAATSVAMAMAVARGARWAWIPALLVTVVTAAVALAWPGTPSALAAVIFAAQLVAAAATLATLRHGGVDRISEQDVLAAATTIEEPATAAPPVAVAVGADDDRRAAPAAPVPWRPLSVGSVALLVACLAQAPGRIIADTKLDLAVDAGGFLSRALHLWDPAGAFGQVQNQAVGYLFPMGPYFAGMDAIGVPMWVAQRVWLALLLSLALWGAALVTRALRVGGPAGWVAAGAAYALSPMFIGQIGAASAAVLPAALLPWALLPLIGGARRGSPRRAATLSGLAVLGMGGVNAVATCAVLVLPALWIATRPAGPRRRALAGWWSAALVLACTWWIVALALQGDYGLNFLAFTETPATTEATTSVLETLRGTGAWLMYLRLGEPWLPAGWTVAAAPALIVATTAVAAAGLAGLASARPLADRRFLLSGVAVGVVCVAAGYAGAAGGLLDAPVRDLLSNSLGPLRNVTKFEPVLRLPLAIGLAHLVMLVPSWEWRRIAATGLGVAAAVGALPLLQGHLAPRGAFERVPQHWRQTAAYLQRHAPDARALVVPAAPFGEYTWGRPMDEPLEPLARSPWAVRNLIPLGGIGSTRLLDVIEERLANGRSSPSLTPLLARAGIRYVVARNDLDWRRTGSPRPAQVHAVLERSGLRRVAAFGPTVPVPAARGDALPDLGVGRREARLASVEIFAVAAPTTLVAAPAQAGTPVVSGGPDAIAQLVARHIDSTGAAVLASDRPAGLTAGAWFVGDGLRRRNTDFGLLHNSTSYTLGPGERAAGSDEVRQLLPAKDPPEAAVAHLEGVHSVTASSYGSWLVPQPESRPDNAFDGDPATAWVASRPDGSQGEWVQATLERPAFVASISVRLLADGPWRPRVVAVRVTTDAGTKVVPVRFTEDVQELPAAAGRTRTVRVSLERVTGQRRDMAGAGLREIGIRGVVVRRFVDVPEEPGLRRASAAASRPPIIAFDRRTADPDDPLRRDEEPQLLRRFTLAAPAEFRLTGALRPRPGPELERLLTRTRGLRVRASSTWSSLPRWRAGNAVDGSARTAWIAQPPAPPAPTLPGSAGRGTLLQESVTEQVSPVPADVDPRPTIVLAWRGTHKLSRVRVLRAGSLAAAPLTLRLTSRHRVRDVTLGRDGTARFAPLRTSSVVVTFPRVERRFTTTPAGRRVALPVGLSELDFPALRSQRIVPLPPSAPLRLRCGKGPTVWIGHRPQLTRVTETAGDVVALNSARLAPCGRKADSLIVPAGRTEVRTAADGAFAVNSLTLRPGHRTAAGGRAGAGTNDRSVVIERWTASARRVRIGPGDAAFLAIRENFNRGWHATFGRRELEPVRLDGWQQGFMVPRGDRGVIDLRYTPDRALRLGLGAGGVLALILLGLALAPTGRPDAPVTLTADVRLAERQPRRRAVWSLRARRLTIAAYTLIALGAVALISVPALLFVPLLALLGWRVPTALAPFAAVTLVTAGIIAAVADAPLPADEAGAFGTPAQVLATAALAATLAGALVRHARRIAASPATDPEE